MSAVAAALDEPDLGNLTRAQAQSLLGERNRDVYAARRAVERADADVMSARVAPNSQLSMNLQNINPSTGIGAGGLGEKIVDSIVRIDQPVERGGKRRLRIDQSQSSAHATREDLAAAIRDQSLALDFAYFDLLLAQQRRSVQSELADLAQSAVDVANKRLAAGDLSPAEVSRIQVDALSVRNDALQAAVELLHARLTLAGLLSLETRSAELRAADAWPAIVTLPAGGGQSTIDRWPDVQSAADRVAASHSALELARAQRSRDVTVGVQYEHYPGATGNTVGVGFSVPLFVGHRFDGSIHAAQVDLRAAESELERTRAGAQALIDRSRSDLNAAERKLRLLQEELLPAAEKSAAAAEFAFARGAINATDLLDARRSQRAARVSVLTAQSDYAHALSAWRRYSDSLDAGTP